MNWNCGSAARSRSQPVRFNGEFRTKGPVKPHLVDEDITMVRYTFSFLASMYYVPGGDMLARLSRSASAQN
jgi:hypothetical protein